MGFLIDILQLFAISAMLTISLNYLVGNVGIVSISQIAFFAVGAYTNAVLVSHYGIPPLVAMFGGISLSMLLAISSGFVATRLSGHYLLLTSLGICEIVRSLANNSTATGGAEGIIVPQSLLPGLAVPANLQVLIATILLLSLEIFFFRRLNYSPKGRIFRAHREDSLLLMVYGRNVTSLEIEALIISSVWASLAGALFAHYSQYVDPTSFSVEQSLVLLIAIMIGGVASTKGSLVGAALLILLPAAIRFVRLPSEIIAPMHQIIFALVLIVSIRFFPKGFFGKFQLP